MLVGYTVIDCHPPVTGENCLEVHTMNVFDELDGNEFIKGMLENSTTVEPSSVTVMDDLTQDTDNCDPFDQRLISYRLRDISPSVAEHLFDLNAEQLSSFFYLANSYTAFENITQEIAEQVAFEEVTGCECFFPRNRIGIVWSETGYPIVEVEG
jgi:hypothetical protein